MRIRLLIALLLLLSPAPRGIEAQAVGDSLQLTLMSRERIVGDFLGRSAEGWRLGGGGGDARLVPADDVWRAELRVIRTRRELRSRSMFVGMLLGTAAGVAVYASSIGSISGDPGLGGMLIFPMAAGGAIYGAGIGWIVGSARPLETWREIPAREQRAPGGN